MQRETPEQKGNFMMGLVLAAALVLFTFTKLAWPPADGVTVEMRSVACCEQHGQGG
ncbi:MAG: hypothetical protein AB1758_01870 [Candidatus Eremiobacterota bacterium]